MKKRLLPLLLGLLLLGPGAWGACPVTSLSIKDGTGTSQTLCADGSSGQYLTTGTPGLVLTTLAAWNSGTSVNATQQVYTGSGAPAVLIQFDTTTTITGGAVTVQLSYDGTNYVAPAADQILDPTSSTLSQVSLPYTLVASTNKPLLVLTHGAQAMQVKLSTAITGTGASTPQFALLSAANVQEVIALSPTAANFNANVSGTVSVNALPTGGNTIGKVDILGNAASTLDASLVAGTPPANGLSTLLQYNTTQPAPTNGQTVSMQGNSAGELKVYGGCAGVPASAVTSTPISLTASGQIITGTASKQTYICSFDLVSATTQNIALVEGTGTVCATSIAGMAGGTTAATGWNLVANGGLTKGDGRGVVFRTATAADNVCLLLSGSGQASGSVQWAQF